MAIFLPSARKRVVGLDFSAHHVNGVAVNKPSNTLSHSDSFELACEFEDESTFRFSPETCAKLRDVVQQFKLQGARVVWSLPNQHVLVRYLDMPSVPESAMRQVVQVEIGTTIHLPFEDPVIDVIPVPTINSKQSVSNAAGGCCLIASPRPIISNMTNLMKQANLIPYAIDMKTFAFLRAAGIEPCGRDVLTLVLHMVDIESSIAIFVGAHLYFFRTMDIGISDGLHDEYELKPVVGDIVYEINRVVSFFNFNLAETERPIGSMYLHTTHAKKAAICNEISLQLGVEVLSVKLNPSFTQMETKNPADMVALGLAMKRG